MEERGRGEEGRCGRVGGGLGRCFTGDFEMSFGDSPVEELAQIPIRETITGYWREVANSWREGTTLERHPLPPIG